MNDVSRKMSVLVADDMPEIRRIISHVLTHSLPVEVAEAENGLEAISVLLGHKPDLIITDLSMPGMTGMEFIGFIQSREDFADIPIIILSTQADERTQMQAQGLHVRACLQKPFNPQLMLQTIRNILLPETVRENAGAGR